MLNIVICFLNKNVAQRDHLRSRDISQLSARPTLLRMKLMIFVLRKTIRSLVNPKKPKLGFALMTMLAIVRPGLANDLLCARANKSSNFNEIQKLKTVQMFRDFI